jgi:hypothetical protein
MEKGYVQDKEEYLKIHDLNEALTTGLAKRSYDEEVVYHLKKSRKSFNEIEALSRFLKMIDYLFVVATFCKTGCECFI